MACSLIGARGSSLTESVRRDLYLAQSDPVSLSASFAAMPLSKHHYHISKDTNQAPEYTKSQSEKPVCRKLVKMGVKAHRTMGSLRQQRKIVVRSQQRQSAESERSPSCSRSTATAYHHEQSVKYQGTLTGGVGLRVGVTPPAASCVGVAEASAKAPSSWAILVLPRE